MHKAHPPPRSARLAMQDPVRCLCCGHVAERKRLAEAEYLKRSMRGIRHLAPGDCEPDEWVTTCPDCGAREAFVAAVRCAECLEYPCVCGPGQDG